MWVLFLKSSANLTWCVWGMYTNCFVSLCFLPWGHFAHHAIEHQHQKLLCILLLSKHNWWMNIYSWIYNLVTNGYALLLYTHHWWLGEDNRGQSQLKIHGMCIVGEDSSVQQKFIVDVVCLYNLWYHVYVLLVLFLYNVIPGTQPQPWWRLESPLKCLNKHFQVQETIEHPTRITYVPSVSNSRRDK